jgi:hypothetical protein
LSTKLSIDNEEEIGVDRKSAVRRRELLANEHPISLKKVALLA